MKEQASKITLFPGNRGGGADEISQDEWRRWRELAQVDPATLAGLMVAVRDALAKIERTKQYSFFSDSGAMVCLIMAMFYNRRPDRRP